MNANSQSSSLDRPIATAAKLTADLPAAIATIAVRGPQAERLILELANLSVTKLRLGKIHYGTWPLAIGQAVHVPQASRIPSQRFERSTPTESSVLESGGIRRVSVNDTPDNSSAVHSQILEEQVVVARTKVDEVEVHCHGGSAVCRGILDALADRGCQIVSAVDWPSEWNERLRVEAEADLISATTSRTAGILLDQLNGSLSRAVQRIVRQLSNAEAAQAVASIDELLKWSAVGEHLIAPWQIVLAGPPNVGKSSLMNAILGQTHSIVHHQPGTTRDWVSAEGAIQGWPILLSDTAGVRSSHEPIEAEGVRRALQQVQQADLVLIVVDATQGWTTVHQQIWDATEHLRITDDRPSSFRVLLIQNKVDLLPPGVGRQSAGETLSQSGSRAGPPAVAGVPQQIETEIKTSTQGLPGVQELIQRIGSSLVPCEPPVGQAVPFRRRHSAVLQAARNEIVASRCLQSAARHLQSLLFEKQS